MAQQSHPPFAGFIGLFLACCLIGCQQPQPAAPLPRPVRVVKVQFENTLTTINYSGEVRVRHEPNLSFQVPGKVAKRLVDVGSVVKPGQLLATLDPPDYQIDQAGANAQLAAAQAELSQARKDLTHTENLFHKNLTSQASLDRRKDAVRAATARTEQAQAALALSARKTAYSELRASHAGVIAAVEAEPGQYVEAGQTIFRLARTAEKEVVINVPENQLDELKNAQTLQASLWAKPGVFYKAKLREISPGVDAMIRTFTVKIALPDAGADVRMGMTATVHVSHTEPKPAAWLPMTAITQLDGQTVVWRLHPDTQTVQPQAIVLGSYGEDNAKVFGGVKDGDLIVTAGVHKLLPGEKVRLLETAQP